MTASPIHVAALVLAAGQSRRMGSRNKLLAQLQGKSMLRKVVEAALACRAQSVAVVIGAERDAVRRVLEGLPVAFIHNVDFAQGLSTSLRAGVAYYNNLDGDPDRPPPRPVARWDFGAFGRHAGDRAARSRPTHRGFRMVRRASDRRAGE